MKDRILSFVDQFRVLRLYVQIRRLLNLKEDFDEQGCVEVIRSNVEFRSGNAWGLIFAIFIASIGLQVNSTAVLIGAMLISPLMGPIIGAGYSLATHDFELLKKSLWNLSYAVGISVITSTLFFLFSPSGLPQSELLSRTQPTFFDVMVGFFGGAAGIVAATRKIKGNAIPGVAIATALMPPLCTAGYGLAHFKIGFIFGALYLFTINATFIFAATYLFVRFLGFQIRIDRDVNRDHKIHKWMTIGSIIVILPSLFMAWYLHKKTTFETNTSLFIEKEMNYPKTVIGQKSLKFQLRGSEIVLKTLGDELPAEEYEKLSQLLRTKYDLDGVELKIVPLANENLSLADLDQRFVTRSDLDQRFVTRTDLLKYKDAESEEKRKSILEVLEKTKEDFEKRYPNRLSGVELKEAELGAEVVFLWKRRPREKERHELEAKLFRNLNLGRLKLTHEF